jgi:hypothetical protein
MFDAAESIFLQGILENNLDEVTGKDVKASSLNFGVISLIRKFGRTSKKALYFLFWLPLNSINFAGLESMIRSIRQFFRRGRREQEDFLKELEYDSDSERRRKELERFVRDQLKNQEKQTSLDGPIGEKLPSIACIICCEKEREVCFFPCRHVPCCQDCASKVTRCPVCRESIDDGVRVFLT